MAYRTDFGSIHQRPLGVFGAPARYVQGPGATWELGRELQLLGFEGPVLTRCGNPSRFCQKQILKGIINDFYPLKRVFLVKYFM